MGGGDTRENAVGICAAYGRRFSVPDGLCSLEGMAQPPGLCGMARLYRHRLGAATFLHGLHCEIAPCKAG